MEPEVYESPDIPVSFVTTTPTSTTVGVAGTVKSGRTNVPNNSASSSSDSPSYKVDDIVDYTVNAKDSFEVFMGRRYDPAERYLSPLLTTDSIVAQQEILYPSHPQFDKLANYLTTTLENGLHSSSTGSSYPSSGSNSRTIPKRLETPLMKYSRLIEEVQTLQKELQRIEELDKQSNGRKNNNNNTNTGSATTPVDHNTGVFRLLTTGTSALDTHLQSLQSTVQNTNGKIRANDDITTNDTIAIPKTSIESIKALQTDIHSLRETQQILLNTAQTITTKLVSMEQNLQRILQDTEKRG